MVGLLVDLWRELSLSWGMALRNPRIRRVLGVYAVLNLLDLLTTYYALRLGLREGNVLYAPLFARYPFAVGALVKVVTAAIAMLCATANYTIWRPAAVMLMTLCTVVLALVVVWNCLELVH